ncbi:hypothetical protein [Bradyrhizobium sp. OK095]|jgi:hypothetical protein|uniref:hypothetical protein n=1 Tax=Bradyrhizobium sp. OK095 TaxID=1882760 RepID=UPI0008AD7572|nr:hypothetical protein [Bradyrhizobium sp. OK095]SEN34818.1 hypothetical protein SAMN05443254_107407 [Bradyrhizobium sp. OK095]
MTDRKDDRPDAKLTAQHLADSVSSGRITPAEAKIIERFFSVKPESNWPASRLQQRMQSSGG